MDSAYNFNLYIVLIQATFSGSIEWSLYTGLTGHESEQYFRYNYNAKKLDNIDHQVFTTFALS